MRSNTAEDDVSPAVMIAEQPRMMTTLKPPSVRKEMIRTKNLTVQHKNLDERSYSPTYSLGAVLPIE